jgi:type II secretory pathway predicted ATPase ExeA
MALVGRTDPLFVDDAVARLHKLSLGLPRARSTMLHAALIAAATAGKAPCRRRVRQESVAELARD